MANKILENEISKIESIPYEILRNQVQTGDLIFTSGLSLFSRIVKKFTNSTFSHCGMIFKVESIDRIMVLESGRHGGVHLTPLSFYAKKYPGKVMLSRLSTPIDTDQLESIFSFGFDQLTRPYDKKELFRIVKRILFNVGKRIKNRNFVCSELIYACFSKAHIYFKYKNELIIPDNIWEDARVINLGRIK